MQYVISEYDFLCVGGGGKGLLNMYIESREVFSVLSKICEESIKYLKIKTCYTTSLAISKTVLEHNTLFIS